MGWMIDNHTRIWRSLIGLFIAGLLSTGAWVFCEVRDLPAIYCEKTVVEKLEDRVTEQIRALENKVLTQQQRMEEKIDETNRFLRNYFSEDHN